MTDDATGSYLVWKQCQQCRKGFETRGGKQSLCAPCYGEHREAKHREHCERYRRRKAERERARREAEREAERLGMQVSVDASERERRERHTRRTMPAPCSLCGKEHWRELDGMESAS